jgi:hypothetical protein
MKYKIEKKVRAHHKVLRREARQKEEQRKKKNYKIKKETTCSPQSATERSSTKGRTKV